MAMDAGIIQIVSAVAILGFLWTLHRDVSKFRKEVGKDIADLRERMATVESCIGALEGRMATVEGRLGAVEGHMEAVESRMARVEGLLENFVGRPPAPQS